MERNERKDLLDRLRYDPDNRNEKWAKYEDCWHKITKFFDSLPPSDEKDEVFQCIRNIDAVFDNLIDKILKVEEAVADLHDTVENEVSVPGGDGGGKPCQGTQGSPVL